MHKILYCIGFSFKSKHTMVNCLWNFDLTQWYQFCWMTFCSRLFNDSSKWDNCSSNRCKYKLSSNPFSTTNLWSVRIYISYWLEKPSNETERKLKKEMMTSLISFKEVIKSDGTSSTLPSMTFVSDSKYWESD